jgi:hypothetical protein
MDIEVRLNRLERSNRRLKAGLLGLGIVAAIVVVLGAAAPIPRVVEATKFVMRDDSGKERAELSMDGPSAIFKVLNPNGTEAAMLASGNTGNGTWLLDSSGNVREAMVVEPQGTAILGITHSQGKSDSLMIEDTEDRTSLTLKDKAGVDRLILENGPQMGPAFKVVDQNNHMRAVLWESGAATFEPNGMSNFNTFFLPPGVDDPADWTAFCHDGSFSYSARRSGSCAGHGGVALWR